MSETAQKTQVSVRYCHFCEEDHPDTEFHWYSRPFDKIKECRVKRSTLGKVRYRFGTSKEYQRDYRANSNNKDKIREFNKRGRESPKGRFRTLRSNAKVRGIPVELTYEQYFELTNNSTCHYCCGQLSKTGGGIDRQDGTLGYTATNSVPCCKKCNLAKHTMSVVEFREWLTAVSRHFLAESGG